MKNTILQIGLFVLSASIARNLLYYSKNGTISIVSNDFLIDIAIGLLFFAIIKFTMKKQEK